MNHRSVRWMVTPDRFARISRRFQVHGTWFCFFGRFIMGVRAAMCMAAGATGFPYWRFFLADFAGALLSVPLFVFLGYWFAGMIPTLRAYVGGVQALILVLAGAAFIVVYVVYRKRKRRRAAGHSGGGNSSAGRGPSAATTEKHAGPAAKSRNRREIWVQPRILSVGPQAHLPGFGQEQLPDGRERLGYDFHVAEHGHEVNVAVPARHDVHVQVLGQPGARATAQVHADIEALGVQGRV